MSIETPVSKDTSVSTSTSKEETPKTESVNDTETSISNYSANLLSTLLSPFSFSKETSTETSKEKTHISIESAPNQEPQQYYAPEETPLFKKLQKTRLTRTRTKQLLRAAEREHNDPPPPPGLGDCCGSSCDPCVRDLWKEEIGIWRERWGDWAEEEDGKDVKKEVKKEDKKPKKKELEW